MQCKLLEPPRIPHDDPANHLVHLRNRSLINGNTPSKSTAIRQALSDGEESIQKGHFSIADQMVPSKNNLKDSLTPEICHKNMRSIPNHHGLTLLEYFNEKECNNIVKEQLKLKKKIISPKDKK